jgi:predicted GIY-YIG superfamily endonuclease
MDVFEGFTKKYALHMLVYYEFGGDVSSAIAREKQLKNWKRAWKIELIESANPSWDDLSRYFMDCGSAPAMTVASPAMTVAAPSITTL